MFQPADPATPWQRALWLRQPGYPDNYLNDTFLENLQRNVHVRKYTYRGLLVDTQPVTQQICCIMVFVATFTHVYNGNISHTTLLQIVCLSLLLGYAWWEKLSASTPERLSIVTSAFTLAVILLLISPILQTLSKATTSDSIWPLSGALLVVNAMLADYNTTPAKEPGATSPDNLPSSLSLNAAICAAAVLSSRLSSHADVFALMLFAIEWFALFPLLRAKIRRRHSDRQNTYLTAFLVILAWALYLPLSRSIASLYLGMILALQFAIPFWLLDLQSLKNEISGPWDAAVPKVSGSRVAI